MSRQFILERAFQDPIWAETVCRTDKTEVNYQIVATLTIEDRLYIQRVFGLSKDETIQDSHLDRLVNVEAEKGLVLTDSRGRGAFQK